MLKPFSDIIRYGKLPCRLSTYESKENVFIHDDAWRVKLIEVVSVPTTTLKKKWAQSVWTFGAVEVPSKPMSHPMFVFHVQVGRGRRNRYSVSDGEVWCDVHGKKVEHDYAKRGWCSEKAPWTLVEAPQARLLNMSVQNLFKMAIKTFWEGKC